jgi:hypothetical protein
MDRAVDGPVAHVDEEAAGPEDGHERQEQRCNGTGHDDPLAGGQRSCDEKCPCLFDARAGVDVTRARTNPAAGTRSPNAPAAPPDADALTR